MSRTVAQRRCGAPGAHAWQRVQLLPHLSSPPRNNAWHDYVQLCTGAAWCP